jgi:CMP-N-acetylneuraminic acid synthetase
MVDTRSRVLGVVPARGGSKGVPRKNLLRLGGRTLLWHAIQSSLQSRYITRTICSTEDDELAEEARAAGADVPFERPLHLASDTAASWAVVRHAVDCLEANGWPADYVVLLQPTTPFRTPQHIDTLLELVTTNNASSGLTIRECDYPPHWMFWRNTDGTLRRLYAEGETIKRRQDAPIAWQPNGLVYVVKRQLLSTDFSLPLADTVTIPMEWEDSINIDSFWQYQLAQILWSAREEQSAHAEK